MRSLPADLRVVAWRDVRRALSRSKLLSASRHPTSSKERGKCVREKAEKSKAPACITTGRLMVAGWDEVWAVLYAALMGIEVRSGSQ